MGRKRKQQVKVNDIDSLEGLMQETYNDACALINDAQRTINEITNATEPQDTDDYAKIAKEKTSALKIKESGIKFKLELTKLQSDIIKHKGNIEETVKSKSENLSLDEGFANIREMLNKDKSDKNAE